MRHHYPKIFADDARSCPRPGACRADFRALGVSSAGRQGPLSDQGAPSGWRCIPPAPPAARWARTCMRAHCSTSCRESMSPCMPTNPNVAVSVAPSRSSTRRSRRRWPATRSMPSRKPVRQTFVSADCGCMLNLNHTLQKRGKPAGPASGQLSCGNAVLARGGAVSARDHILQRLRRHHRDRYRCRPTCMPQAAHRAAGAGAVAPSVSGCSARRWLSGTARCVRDARQLAE
jgi:hypothetical protein